MTSLNNPATDFVTSTIIAALTRARQQAMARIEALEH